MSEQKTCQKCHRRECKTSPYIYGIAEVTDCLQAQIDALTARLAEAESDLLKFIPWKWKGTLGDFHDTNEKEPPLDSA